MKQPLNDYFGTVWDLKGRDSSATFIWLFNHTFNLHATVIIDFSLTPQEHRKWVTTLQQENIYIILGFSFYLNKPQHYNKRASHPRFWVNHISVVNTIKGHFYRLHLDVVDPIFLGQLRFSGEHIHILQIQSKTFFSPTHVKVSPFKASSL